jgi:hypothetical protein
MNGWGLLTYVTYGTVHRMVSADPFYECIENPGLPGLPGRVFFRRGVQAN